MKTETISPSFKTISVCRSTPKRGKPAYFFGPELREMRQSKNMPVLVAAAAIGIDPSFLSRLETGKRGVHVESNGIMRSIERTYSIKIATPES